MRIDPSGGYSPVAPTPTTNKPAAETAPAAADQTSSFVPTADLARLIAAVKSEPEVRWDVVQQVLTKLTENQRGAAMQVAEAILDARAANG